MRRDCHTQLISRVLDYNSLFLFATLPLLSAFILDLTWISYAIPEPWPFVYVQHMS